jgi:hypothetical protein
MKRNIWTVLLLLGMVLFFTFTGCKELDAYSIVFTNHSSKTVVVTVEDRDSFTLSANGGSYTQYYDYSGSISWHWTPSGVHYSSSEEGKVDFYDN